MIYYIVSIALLIITFVVFYFRLEKRKLRAREIVLIAVVTSICVALNILCSHTVPLHAGTAIVVLAGVALGPDTGFVIGALARFVCNFFDGQGPWTPWQMIAWGIIGFLAGAAFNKVMLRKNDPLETPNYATKIGLIKKKDFTFIVIPIVSVIAFLALAYVAFIIFSNSNDNFFGWWIYAFGFVGLIVGVILQRKRLPANPIILTIFTFVTVVIIYGGIMNFATVILTAMSGGEPVSVSSLKVVYITGLPYDLAHGITAGICVVFLGDIFLQKIERVLVKYKIILRRTKK